MPNFETINGERVLRVDTPRWGIKGPQVWRDSWTGTERVMRFEGLCIGCGRRTYAFDDGGNDPRGILGDHAGCSFSAEEYDMQGPEVPCCFLCQNDTEAQYLYALGRAKARWRRWTPATVTA
jgi:hypothetical protein